MIVIPMAGLSSRFKRAGFELPKYMLDAKGQSLFEHSVCSFEHYFDTTPFLFIALDVYNTEQFIRDKCKALNIANYRIVILDQPTRGQAETVYLGLKAIHVPAETAITVFNIDTFRPGFYYPNEFDVDSVDGYLETFIGSGENWSNVLPENKGSNKAKLTAEKQQISEFCCTGLYHFKRAGDFITTFENDRLQGLDKMQGGEFYIAPMYNQLIAKGADIRFSVVESKDVIFCGVPDEYYAFTGI